MQDLYIKNNKILLKKIKEHIQEWKDILCSVCAQSHLTLCHPMDYIAPGSSVHGISQARILKWVAISYSRGVQCNPSQKSFSFFLEFGKLILKFAWRCRGLRIAKTMLDKEQSWRIHTLHLQNLLQ